MKNKTLDQLSRITFSEAFGFTAFTEDEVASYRQDSSRFSFSLKRKKGLLYGLEHARLRRELFNELPQSRRLDIFQDKARYFGLDEVLSEFIGGKKYTLVDVEDIGMGGLVFKLTINSLGETQELVLKQKQCDAQQFFCTLLDQIQWPSFRVKVIENRGFFWELSEYVGEQLMSFLLSATREEKSVIELSIAKHAALGDVFGQGDRHLENYVMKGSDVYNIDVAFLFWPNNDFWTEKYIAGGVYEYNFLKPYINTSEFLEHKDRFWAAYLACWQELREKRSKIVNCIKTYYNSPLANIHYVERALDDPAFVDNKQVMYQRGLNVMLERSVYKSILQEIVKVNGDLALPPALRMYYYADQGRLSNFLHCEDPAIFSEISDLAETVLGRSRSDIQSEIDTTLGLSQNSDTPPIS